MTALLNLRFGILHLLASILTMIALYSINLRIMGKPNVAVIGQATVATPSSACEPAHEAAVRRRHRRHRAVW